MKLITILLLTNSFILSACSQSNIYDGIQQNRRLHCERMQGTARDECLEQYDTSYEDYKTKRESVNP